MTGLIRAGRSGEDYLNEIRIWQVVPVVPCLIEYLLIVPPAQVLLNCRGCFPDKDLKTVSNLTNLKLSLRRQSAISSDVQDLQTIAIKGMGGSKGVAEKI